MSLTPPVTRNNFHYANGELFVTSTNQNRHRRATLPELQALFHPGPGQTVAKDPPAHWYKAQLLHYGLQPSDVKGTAVKRLLDAVNTGRIEVPAHIRRLELDLKKEWEANDRKAKRGLAAANKSGTSAAGGKSKKRKAEDDGATAIGAGTAGVQGVNVGGMNFHFNFNFAGAAPGGGGGGGGSPVATVNTPAPAAGAGTSSGKSNDNKRARADAGNKLPKATQPRQKQTAAKTQPKSQPKPKAEPKQKSAESKPKTGQWVKKEAPVKKEQKVQRESGVKAGPTPKWELQVKNDYPAAFSSPSSARAPSLGLLNGVYEVAAFGFEEVGNYENNGCTITLCLDRKSLWGAFEFGDLHGVLYFPERPWASSPDARIPFRYCGYDDEERRDLTALPDNTGWARFLGNGSIEGCFEDLAQEPYSAATLDVGFRGYRISGQETRPPRDAYSMQGEWNDRHEDID